MNIGFLARRLSYWLRWALHQLIRFLIGTPTMLVAFTAFIGGTLILALSHVLVGWSHRYILPAPQAPEQVVEPM